MDKIDKGLNPFAGLALPTDMADATTFTTTYSSGTGGNAAISSKSLQAARRKLVELSQLEDSNPLYSTSHSDAWKNHLKFKVGDLVHVVNGAMDRTRVYRIRGLSSDRDYPYRLDEGWHGGIWSDRALELVERGAQEAGDIRARLLGKWQDLVKKAMDKYDRGAAEHSDQSIYDIDYAKEKMEEKIDLINYTFMEQLVAQDSGPTLHFLPATPDASRPSRFSY